MTGSAAPSDADRLPRGDWPTPTAIRFGIGRIAELPEACRLSTEVGMRPQESIYCATMNATRLLRRENDLGSLEAGKFADIVGCRGDPLADITELTRIAFVMKGGAVYKDELTR